MTSGGGRREIPVTCPDCNARTTIPASAVMRNNYYCSSCGKAIDLTQAFRIGPPAAPGEAPALPRRDRGNSRYKSARKGRR